MTVKQYQNQLEKLKGQTLMALLALIKAVLPFQEETRLVFRIEKTEGHWKLRLSPVGIAYDKEKEEEAINHIFVKERSDDVLIVRRVNGEFKINFGVPSEDFGSVFTVSKAGEIDTLFFQTPEYISHARKHCYSKEGLLKEIKEGLLGNSEDKNKKVS